MRIAIGIESLTGGGAERIVRQLAVGLAQRGHRTFVYCLKSARIDPAELIAAGVTIRQARSEGFDPGLLARLAQWTRRDRVDVINAQSSAAACFLLPAAKWCGVPILHTRQGVLLGRPTRYRRCAERLASWFDAIGVVTPALLDSLRPARARRNAVWLPNCVDRPRLDAEPSRRLLETLAGRQLGAPIVLAVGTICPEKDPIGLLRAFARLRDEIRSARLVWIGPTRDIAYRADVHAMERALGLEGWVHWLGEVENAWRVMAGADVFCLPSRTEGMPVVVVEAMSQAAPIVATAVGGVGATGDDGDRQAYLIRDGSTGWLVPPADPDCLADALLSAVTNRDEARRRAEAAAAEYRRRLTADAMLTQYEAAFESMVERRRGRPASVRSGGPRRPCVLMVGPGGDQVGGMVTAVDNLCGAGESRLPYEAVRWVTPRRNRPRRGDRPSLIRSIARHCADLWGFTRALYLHRPDIVHLHTCSHFSFYRDLVQLVLARAARKPVVLHIHGSQFPEFCASAPRRVRRLIRRACEAADTVIVLSEYWERRIRPHVGRVSIARVPNGVSLPRMSLRTARRGDDCRFLFLGNVSRRKGVGELLEAVAILRERNVRCSVEVVGPAIGEDGGVSNEQLRRWRRVADCLGLSGRVQFTGPLRGAALEARWRRADCLVLPSHNEGMPYVVLEAGARRKAVIATQVGGIPDLLAPDRAREPLALLVRPCDPTELAGAMARLAGDARLREALADRLYEHVRRHYTIERQIRRLGEVYERIRPFTRTAGVSSCPLRRVDEVFCGTVLYPLHERLRGRSTRGELSVLQRLRRAERGDLESETRRRLRATLEHAERKTGYYRSLFARYGVDVRAKDIEREVRKLPLLTKAEIRRHEAMMVDSDAPGGLIPYASGGTTGDTLKFSIDRIRQAQSIAARLAGQSWFGVRVGDRRAYLWGAPIESRGAGWRRMRDALLNEIVLDAFDLSDEKMDEHLRRLARFHPRCLYAYPTAAARLAEYALRRKRRLCVSGLQLVVLTGEEVAEEQRDIVRRAFGCRVAAEYGSRETGTIAHECPYGRMHVFAPHAYVEVVRDGRPIGFGEVGEIVVTVLNTRAQPLIRYRIGDAGALETSACPCGSALPVMRVAGGKITGFIVLRDGRVAHGAVTSHMLRGEHGVIAYRTIQHDVNVFEVLLETDERFDSQAVQRIRRRYARVFGEDVRVDVRVVDRIAPDPSGKRRYVISHVAERMKSFRTVSPEAAQQPNVAPVDDVVTSRAHS